MHQMHTLHTPFKNKIDLWLVNSLEDYQILHWDMDVYKRVIVHHSE